MIWLHFHEEDEEGMVVAWKQETTVQEASLFNKAANISWLIDLLIKWKLNDNYFYSQLTILSIFWYKNVKICCFQLLNCTDLLLIFVIKESKWRVFFFF